MSRMFKMLIVIPLISSMIYFVPTVLSIVLLYHSWVSFSLYVSECSDASQTDLQG